MVSTPRERERFASVGLGREATKVIFSIKESVYKAYYPLAGRLIDFLDVEIEPAERAGGYRARLVRDEAPSVDGRRHFEGGFHAGGAFVASACIIGAVARAEEER